MSGLYDTDGRMRVNLGTTAGDAGSAAPVPTQEVPASAGSTITVPSSVSIVPLRASNPTRKALVINNDSTAILYVLLGTGIVTPTFYTYAIPPKGTVPAGVSITGFTGAVSGVWSAANGGAYVTELS